MSFSSFGKLYYRGTKTAPKKEIINNNNTVGKKENHRLFHSSRRSLGPPMAWKNVFYSRFQINRSIVN